MTHSANFIAVDLGATSGRLMVGQWDGRVFSLEELHRFPNNGVSAGDSLYWDVLGIWSEIQHGLTLYHTRFKDPPQGIGVDAWGVDFALLDRHGHLTGNPSHYRDSRTQGMTELVFEGVGERDVFSLTGVQTMQCNTLFQLFSMVRGNDPQLDSAETLLMIPDLFAYFLAGDKSIEYSEATTTQMYSPARNDWAWGMLDHLGLPTRILGNVVSPGTVLSPLESKLLRSSGFSKAFPAIAVASHDTASAVAAIPNMDENSLFISSGTWSLMGVEGVEAHTSDEAYRLQFTNEGGASGSILLLRNLTGLWIIQECLRLWEKEGNRYDWDDLISTASRAKALESFVDPNASDFQMPADMPNAIRGYCRATGQSIPATAGAIARCVFESLSLKYRSVLDDMELLTHRRLGVIRVVGGGALNRFLCQMIADACNRPVIAGPVEASAMGNVMLQAVATGHLSSVSAGRAAISASIPCTSFDPHPGDAWDEAYSRFKNLEKWGKSRLAS